MSVMGPGEFEALISYVSARYAASGQPPDIVAALDQHNERVLTHVEEIAGGESVDGKDYEMLKTIAILHDAAKADTHLMLHAEAGAEIAEEKLQELGKDAAFIADVLRGIRCHMGPFPFIDEEAKKYADRTGEHLHFPKPETRVDQLFYDADMLALMDIDGVEKVVVLRTTTPQFIEEDEATTARDGGTPRAAAYRSAFQSVERAAATLFSDTAKRIAVRLMDEAREHIDQRLSAEGVQTS